MAETTTKPKQATVKKPMVPTTREVPPRVYKAAPTHKLISIYTDAGRAVALKALRLALGTEPFLTADERVEAEALAARLAVRQ